MAQFPLTNNNDDRSRSPPSPSAVADGLRAVVSTNPANVGKMLSAPGETVDALVDRLAGVMSVNSLSAEAVLARFFSQDLLASHLVDALGKSGKGNPATLAARIVAQWKPGKPAAAGIKRKSRGEVAAAAALAASGAPPNAPAPPPPSGAAASSVPAAGPAAAPETATADAEPKNKHARSEPTAGTAPVRPPSGAASAGDGDLRSPSFGFLSPDAGPGPAAARPAVRDTFIVRDPSADVTDDGAVWVTHASQDDALTANWRMRRVHFDRSENGDESVATSTSFAFRDGSVSLRTRHCGVVRQRARDYNQITPKGLVYKVERGGCPLCCGDEVFLLTMQSRADPPGAGTGTATGTGMGTGTGTDSNPRSPSPGMMLSLPGDPTRALPKHRLRMDNWLECHCEGGVARRLEEEVDVGYVVDGTAPKDIFAHLAAAGQARIDAVERERKRLGK